ncbi:evolutionarily conserved signaling intermediate in Toll pathway, mitochondrial isoform X2 [Planococcus citri]
MVSTVFRQLIRISLKSTIRNNINVENFRCFSVSNCFHHNKYVEDRKQQLTSMEIYFNREKQKNKQTFGQLVEFYKDKNFRTGHVEFVYCAMKKMYEFGVNTDLESYKKIIDVMPKEKMVAENLFQADTMFYPKHQMAIVDLMVQMEENEVMPDRDMQDLILSIFGRRSQPIKKYWRMMYWMPKFKNASPWLLPRPVPKDPLQLSKLAMSRMCSIDLESEVEVFKTSELEDDTEDTWIVNGQSPTQRTLLLNHPQNQPIYLEGGFKIYLRKSAITYFVLRADVPPNRRKKTKRDTDVVKNLRIPFFDHPDKDDIIPKISVHEQNDGIIYAIAATGTSSKNSLLSWLRLLEKHGNPTLGKIPIVFKMSSPLGNSNPIEGIDSGDVVQQIGTN